MKKLLICLLVIASLTCLCLAAEGKPASEAKATWTDGTETFEGTVEQCMVKVNEKGGTLTLLEDVVEPGTAPTMRNDIDDADYIIGSNKVFTLDLNGHTLYTEQMGAIYVNGGEEGGLFIVKNGKIVSLVAENIYVANCGLQVLGVEMRSKKSQNISYYDHTDRYNKDNLIEDCVLVNPIWYAFVFNNRKVEQSATNMTFINTTIAVLKDAGHFGRVNGNITLGAGVKLYAYGQKMAGGTIQVLGEPLTTSQNQSVTVMGEEYDLITCRATPEKPSVDISKLIPGETAPTQENSPATRTYELTPVEEQLKAAEKEESKKEETKPATEAKAEGGNMGLIIGIVAAIAVIAVVVVIVSKKKKQ